MACQRKDRLVGKRHSIDENGTGVPEAGAGIVQLMLGDALAGVALAGLAVAHAVDDVCAVCPRMAQLVQELIFGLGVLQHSTAPW